jgi:hypothetical protein
LPLRKLLRAERIQGGTQRPPTPHGRWYIERRDRARRHARTETTKVRRRHKATSETVSASDAARRLAPEKIIVIKSGVFDLVRDALLDAGLPLVDERVPFPGSGQQRRFETSFARASRRKPPTQTR